MSEQPGSGGSVYHRIAQAGAGRLFAVLVISWIAPYPLTLIAFPPSFEPALLAIPMGALCLWFRAIFRVARTARPELVQDRPGWLFALPPGLCVVAGIAGWSMKNSPAALAFFILLGFVIWLAAHALTKAEDGKASFGGVLAAMGLMYFWIFGVWILAPRLQRLDLASRQAGVQT